MTTTDKALVPSPFHPDYPVGMISGEPDTHYHSQTAISNSKLRVFIEDGPVYYKAEYIDKVRQREETTPLKMGKAIHAILADPDLFAEDYIVWSGYVKRGSKDEMSFNKNTKAWADFCGVNEDKICLTRPEYENIRESASAVNRHPVVKELITAKGSQFEVTFRVKIEIEGVQLYVQCRTDCLNLEGCKLSGGKPYIVDFKTQDKLGSGYWDDFRGKWARFHYYRQAPFYSTVINTFHQGLISNEQFFFVAIEREAPYQIAVYQQSHRSFDLGHKENVRGLQQLATCMTTNYWPGQPETIQELDFNDWEYEKLTARKLA